MSTPAQRAADRFIEDMCNTGYDSKLLVSIIEAEYEPIIAQLKKEVKQAEDQTGIWYRSYKAQCISRDRFCTHITNIGRIIGMQVDGKSGIAPDAVERNVKLVVEDYVSCDNAYTKNGKPDLAYLDEQSKKPRT